VAQWKEEVETKLWELYQNGLDYQNSIDLRAQIDENIRYFEGKQWPSPTESTKNLPRPVVNIVKMICRSKKSAILASPLKIFYKSYTQGADISKFNSFASELLKELGQDGLDRIAIDSAVKKGSYFYHYYWDKDALTLTGKRQGSLRCELIDPLNIFFQNPAQSDEQKQGWILIASHKDLSEVLSLCGGKISEAELERDKGDNGYITVLTRYFKISSEVYFEQATKSHIITPPTALAPMPLNNSELSTQGKDFVHASLYPIVCGCYERRQGSIYGISEIEGIIPNQKAINFNIAMSLLNAQECAWGKYIALPNALKGQKISNVPGQVLIDHTGTGEGIKKMPDNGISEIPMNMSSELINITRNISGASELMSGEVVRSLSGTAIAQLQAQAQLPIEDLKNEFIEVKRKQGLVLAQFMKLFFYKREFIIRKSAQGDEKEYFDLFSSSDYENSIFDVVVEVTSSTRTTVASDISLLNSCFSNGSISLETYIRAYPDSAISNKTELLKYIKEQNTSELEQVKKELTELKSKNTAQSMR